MAIKKSPTLEIIRGDDNYLNLTFREEDGTPIDITGDKVYFTVKRRATDPDAAALIAVDVTSHSNPAIGKSVIPLLHATTSLIAEGTYTYDLQLKDPSNRISSTRRGVFNVIEDVTKRTN